MRPSRRISRAVLLSQSVGLTALAAVAPINYSYTSIDQVSQFAFNRSQTTFGINRYCSFFTTIYRNFLVNPQKFWKNGG